LHQRRERRGTTAAINAITAAVNAGFKVYVIGLAIGGGGVTTLNNMAVAGGVPRNDPTTKYYPVANRADLVTDPDRHHRPGHQLRLPAQQPPPVPSNVKVTVDGMKVEENMMNGWSYTSNNMAIQFKRRALRADQDGHRPGEHRVRLPRRRDSIVRARPVSETPIQ
jgi:hypothetical protein